jgi:hypothetical protein
MKRNFNRSGSIHIRVIWPPSRVAVEMPGAAEVGVKPSPAGGANDVGLAIVCGVVAAFVDGSLDGMLVAFVGWVVTPTDDGDALQPAKAIDIRRTSGKSTTVALGRRKVAVGFAVG